MIDDYSKAIKELREKMLLSQKWNLLSYLEFLLRRINRWENGQHEPTIKIKRKLRSLFKEYDVKVS